MFAADDNLFGEDDGAFLFVVGMLVFERPTTTLPFSALSAEMNST